MQACFKWMFIMQSFSLTLSLIKPFELIRGQITGRKCRKERVDVIITLKLNLFISMTCDFLWKSS